MEHHWIENTALVEEDDPSFICKHCPAVGEFYSIVEGVNEIDDEDDVIVEVPHG